MFQMIMPYRFGIGCCVNPFMSMGMFNPRMNFFLGLAGAFAGINPYFPVMPFIPFGRMTLGNCSNQTNYSQTPVYLQSQMFRYNSGSSATSCISSIPTPIFSPSVMSVPVLNPFSVSSYLTPQGASSLSLPPVSGSENYDGSALQEIRNSSLMKRVPDQLKNRILAAVDKSCKKYNVDPKLVIAMMAQESNFDPGATSCCGAAGLMQLMPGTAKQYGASDPYNIEQNIDAAVKFIKYLKDRYNGNMDLMIAAYNAGPGRVKDHVPNIAETKNYVAKVKKNYASLT